jgi:hypothetical protein
VLGELAGTDLTTKADGYAAAVVSLAKCAKDVRGAHDGALLTKAAISCVSAIDEDVAKQLAVFLDKRGVKNAGKLAGKIVGKVTIYLALVGPVFDGLNYWVEGSAADSTHTVTVFPKIQPKIPSLPIAPLPLPDLTKAEEQQLESRLTSSDIVPGSADGCEYLAIVGWSDTGMDLFTGVHGSSETRNCPGDPYESFRAYRHGSLVAQVQVCDCPIAPGTGNLNQIEQYYSKRPALLVVQQGGGWEFVRTTWGAVS